MFYLSAFPRTCCLLHCLLSVFHLSSFTWYFLIYLSSVSCYFFNAFYLFFSVLPSNLLPSPLFTLCLLFISFYRSLSVLPVVIFYYCFPLFCVCMCFPFHLSLVLSNHPSFVFPFLFYFVRLTCFASILPFLIFTFYYVTHFLVFSSVHHFPHCFVSIFSFLLTISTRYRSFSDCFLQFPNWFLLPAPFNSFHLPAFSTNCFLLC